MNSHPYTNAVPCLACSRPVRRSHIVTEVTVYLDAIPHAHGSYYYDDEGFGLILEDADGYVRGPKFRRHRCAPVRQPAVQVAT